MERIVRHLTNEGVIRKSETITLGANSFGLTGVQMDVTALGTLSSVQVDRVGGSHPQANAETATGEYWNISPTGTGFTLDLTLPHNLADSNEAQVCRFTGTGWDCDADAATDNTVTRNQITGLSDWAIGRIARSGSHLSLPLILNLP